MEGTIKAVPIAIMVPENPDWSKASSRPAWLKPVISSTFSYRRSKALLPETKIIVQSTFTYKAKCKTTLHLKQKRKKFVFQEYNC